MQALSSLGRARSAFQRWFASGHEENHGAANDPAGDDGAPDGRPDSDRQIQEFMEEVKANSQEWLGRVRLINFDSIKDRLGPTWPRLQKKVELLAEKVIGEMLSGRDLCLNIGAAEFLVFIADVSPEEVRIRCLAVVEKIHEKLFGVSDEIEKAGRFAECHVAQTENVELELQRPASPGRTPREAMRGLFRPDAEMLDGADIAASAQNAMDAILQRACESRDIGELGAPSERLRCLSRDLKLLEPSLGGETAPTPEPVLRPVWQDIGELVGVLDATADDSHAVRLAALTGLRKARRARNAPEVTDTGHRLAAEGGEEETFYYVPVYRSVAQGEQVFKGIYRVKPIKTARPAESGAIAGESEPQGSAPAERLVLQHALDYWADKSMAKRFMLMVPVHVETLRRPNSLRQYSTLLRAASLAAKRRLVIEITGYQEGDNSIGTRRGVEELRAHCHALFVSLSDDFAKLPALALECKKLGVRAVGLDVTNFALSRGDSLGALQLLGTVGERLAMPTFVDGIAGLPVLARAIALGITYFCAPGLIPGRPEPEEVERISLNDLFTAI